MELPPSFLPSLRERRRVTGPLLTLDHVAGQRVACAVHLRVPCPALLSRMAALAEDGDLRTVLKVTVVSGGGSGDDALPPVAGRCEAMSDGARFTPFFPFVAGVYYRASFDPHPLGWPGEAVMLDFFQPAERGEVPEVACIFPSAGELPENLLRFHVCFSGAMQRGLAGTEVRLLAGDGQEVPDALYHAPVELWDRDMHCLTVLLDPGRLKRGVGPNRALGPPLRAGQCYALAIGAGMTGASGLRLSRQVLKPFRAMPPVREAIAAKDWDLATPAAGSCERLRLRFNRPLDWALLRRAVTVTDQDGNRVAGTMEIEEAETEVGFTPAVPWVPARQLVSVSPELEDVCGNHATGAFDRPLRDGPPRTGAAAALQFQFHPR